VPTLGRSDVLSIALNVWRHAVMGVALIGCVSQSGRGPAGISQSRAGDQDPLLTPVREGANPCTDFADYACGSKQGSPGRLQREAEAMGNRQTALRRFFEELANGQHDDGSKSTAVVREFYTRCKDAGARERGLKEIRDELNAISQVGSLPDLARMLGKLRASGLPVLVYLEPYWEAIASDGPIVARVRLATPRTSRSARLTKDQVRTELRAHLLRLAALTGDVGGGDVDAALRIDDWLARSTPTKDDSKISSPIPLVPRAELVRRRFPWEPYLTAAGLSLAAPIRPTDPQVMQKFDHLAEQPLADLKSYVRVKVLEASVTFLTQAFLDEDRRFQSEILDGENHQAIPLAASCADLTWGILEAWVAKAYLAELASAASEDAARRMFGLVRSNLVQTIDRAPLIDNQSRRASASKVGQTRLLFVRDVEPKRLAQLVLAPGSFRAALLQIATHVNAEGLAEIGHPSSPPELYPNFGGAIYSRNVNALWVSPEIARPPYLDMGRFGAVSFGAFGTLIGHELAHSVSPDGIGYDAAGLLRETWSATARDAFKARLRCLERQLEGARADTKNKMDVHRVLDEHVADLVGVRVALSAMESDTAKSLDSDTRRARRRDFFIAYAQQECGWSGDLDVPVDDQHAPARARIDSVLSNVPEFAATFQCASGTPMAPVDRCSLW